MPGSLPPWVDVGDLRKNVFAHISADVGAEDYLTLWKGIVGGELDGIKQALGPEHDSTELSDNLPAVVASMGLVLQSLRAFPELDRDLGYLELLYRELNSVADGRRSQLFEPQRARGRPKATRMQKQLAARAAACVEALRRAGYENAVQRVFSLLKQEGVTGWENEPISAKTVEAWHYQASNPTEASPEPPLYSGFLWSIEEYAGGDAVLILDWVKWWIASVNLKPDLKPSG